MHLLNFYNLLLHIICISSIRTNLFEEAENILTTINGINFMNLQTLNTKVINYNFIIYYF